MTYQCRLKLQFSFKPFSLISLNILLSPSRLVSSFCTEANEYKPGHKPEILKTESVLGNLGHSVLR